MGAKQCTQRSSVEIVQQPAPPSSIFSPSGPARKCSSPEVPLDLIRRSKSGSVAQRLQSYERSLAQDASTHPKTSVARADYGAEDISAASGSRKLSAAARGAARDCRRRLCHEGRDFVRRG